MAAGEIVSRMKSQVGRYGTLTDLPSATDLLVPDGESVFTVSGTTQIDTINSTGNYIPGRTITLMFTGTLTLTDTALSGTAQGKVHTGSTSPANGAAISLVCANNGSWWQVGYSANG